ncbi:MAG: hypothetical protein PHV37_07555 [Candidatus Gastranaerophilales bacterium]|nr:hypothetical protein [Candidatus Gastranaerophilales bacterium]
MNKVLYVTGGGGLSPNAINISTLAAIAASSVGLQIIKHTDFNGLKKCNAGHFLDFVNVKIANNISDVEKYLAKNGIAFIEAEPQLVLENLCPILTLGSDFSYFIGLNSTEFAMQYMFELKNKNVKNAIIACSIDPLFDEVSVTSGTQIFELRDGKISNYVINPTDYTIEQVEAKKLTGATPLYNANLAKDILSCKTKDAKFNAIALNMALMFYATKIAPSIEKAIIAAFQTLESGKAFRKYLSIAK